jgi:Cdc6-like AAA superfamily ATPase
MGMTSSFFTGRQDILEKLDVFFAPRDTGGSPRREFLLYGMGGVGKSEIAFKVSEVLEKRRVKSRTPAACRVRLTICQIRIHLLHRWFHASHRSSELCQHCQTAWLGGCTYRRAVRQSHAVDGTTGRGVAHDI